MRLPGMNCAPMERQILSLNAKSDLRGGNRLLPVLEGIEDEKARGGADATVGHVECGPGRDRQRAETEEQEVDDVSVQNAVGEVAQDAGDQERQRDPAQLVREGAPRVCDEQRGQREEGDDDEEAVAVRGGEDAEGGPRIGEIDEIEQIGRDGAALVQREVMGDEPLRSLVKQVERQGQQEPGFHPGNAPTTSEQRLHNSGWRGSSPTPGRWRQQRSHFLCLLGVRMAFVSGPGPTVSSLRMKNSSSSPRSPPRDARRGASAISRCTAASSALPMSFSCRAFSTACAMTARRFRRVSTRSSAGASPGSGRSSRCTDAVWPAAPQASSAVKTRMGASNFARESNTLAMAAWVARRRGEAGASQYIRSLVMSIYRLLRSTAQNWFKAW